MAQVHSKSEQKSEAKSDPIEGSLGHPKSKAPPPNEDARLEEYLRSKTPMKYKIDPLEHPDTQDSIEWAQNYYGHEVGNPRIENVTETWQFTKGDPR